MNLTKTIFFFLFSCLSTLLISQQVVVDSILISGNKKTKDYIILRECPILIGDTLNLADLSDQLAFAEKRILSTGLFINVQTNIPDWDVNTQKINVEIEVEENWYYYLFPIFEIADRNFNVWWSDQNRSFDRINYGIEGKIRNFTGHNDNFQIKAQTGYNDKWGISYTRPFLSKNSKFGIDISAYFRTFNETNYGTFEDRQLFFDFDSRDEIALRNRDIRLGILHRKNTFVQSGLYINYEKDTYNQFLVDSLSNRVVFGDDNVLEFLSLDYFIQLDRRDVLQYPLSGDFYRLEVRKIGLGFFDDVNLLPVRASFGYFKKLNAKTSINTRQILSVNLLNNDIPYKLSRGVGFGSQQVRGYDRFNVEGEHSWVGKFEINRLLFNKTIKFGKIMPIKAFRKIPIRAYIAFFTDAGYVRAQNPEEGNRLPNTLLLSAGSSLDFVIYNDFVFKFYVASDKEGRTGFFLQFDYLF